MDLMREWLALVGVRKIYKGVRTLRVLGISVSHPNVSTGGSSQHGARGSVFDFVPSLLDCSLAGLLQDISNRLLRCGTSIYRHWSALSLTQPDKPEGVRVDRAKPRNL